MRSTERVEGRLVEFFVHSCGEAELQRMGGPLDSGYERHA
jgi:hypothetical protein